MRRITTRKARFETVSLEPTSSYALMRSRGNGYALQLHYHPELELTLIQRGRGMRFVGDSILPFTEGDLCLLGPNLLHSWYTGDSPQRTEAIVIQFAPTLPSQMAGHWPELKRLQGILAASARGQHFTGALRDRVADLMCKASLAPAASARRISLLIEILEQLATGKSQTLSTAAPVPPQANPALSRFARVIDSLHRQMPAPPDQGTMAESAGMTPASFCRFFRRFTGRSYIDYVNGWRIGLACRQLLQTDLPITHIAFECGFENLSNFNRRFRQYKKTTPREYRQMGS